MFDNELGDVLYLIGGYTCKITALSLSIPPKIKRLVPILVTGDHDGYIKAYNLQSGDTLLNNISNYQHNGPINSIFINEKGCSLIFAAVDSEVHVWNWDSERLINTIKDHTSTVKSIACCTQRSQEDINYEIVCTAGHDGMINIYDLLTLDKIDCIDTGLLVNCIVVGFISCTEVFLVLGSFEGILRIYDMTQPLPPPLQASSSLPFYNIIHNIQSSESPIYAVAMVDTIVPAFVSAGADMIINIYDLKEGSILASVSGTHTGPIRSIDVTIDPRFIIVTGGHDNKAIVIDIHKIADNDEDMMRVLAHLKLKPFHFESKKVYLFEKSIDEDSSSILTDYN